MGLMTTPITAATLVAFALLAGEALAQNFTGAPICYAVTYDSIQAGFERQALSFTLKLRPGSTRGPATTEDTSSVWQLGTGNSYWRRARDSLFVMLSNGQFELWMHLAPIGDTLRGWVRYRTDVEPSVPPRARVTAERTPCRRIA